jgi:hypothetical protein
MYNIQLLTKQICRHVLLGMMACFLMSSPLFVSYAGFFHIAPKTKESADMG